MTIGIYKINFNNTDKVYIGQSRNLEKRRTTHYSSLASGSSPKKLQNAYNTFGIHSIETLVECSIEELDKTEEEAIEIFNSIANGFNSLPSNSPPILPGESNHNSTEANDTYRNILKLLIQSSPTYTKREISEILDVSLYTVRHIAALESHIWLKEDMPEEYAALEDIKNNRYNRGTQYPRLVSPEGIEYEVTHVTNFSKQHGLSQPKVSDVLHGHRKTHKGWKRA